jgi:hypothetical protein
VSLDTVHDRATDDDEHGIRGAVYQRQASRSLIGKPTVLCVFECLCGITFEGDTWEEAGICFDHHLEVEELRDA